MSAMIPSPSHGQLQASTLSLISSATATSASAKAQPRLRTWLGRSLLACALAAGAASCASGPASEAAE